MAVSGTAVVVERVLAPNPGLMTGTGTNTYLVRSPGDRGLVVVDPGPDDPRHLGAILEAAQPVGEVQAILVTHGHADHLPAARPLRERTGAPILGHARLPGVDRALADDESWPVGSGRLQALETPGHTDDSLCYWDPVGRALFTGDVVAGAGTVIVDDAPGGLARYLASLRRLERLGTSRVYPGHGPLVEDGRARVRAYLDHRAAREQQVLAVLRARGRCTVQEVVAAVYAEVPDALLPMAARNVRAHLRKLADEHRAVALPDDTWSPAG